MGCDGNTGGLKIIVSVPQTKPIIPRKKKEMPTVTIMTVNTGSPINGRKKMRSTSKPRTSPTIRVKIKAIGNGSPH